MKKPNNVDTMAKQANELRAFIHDIEAAGKIDRLFFAANSGCKERDELESRLGCLFVMVVLTARDYQIDYPYLAHIAVEIMDSV